MHMHTFTQETARDCASCKLTLEVQDNNQAARLFYKELGLTAHRAPGSDSNILHFEISDFSAGGPNLIGAADE